MNSQEHTPFVASLKLRGEHEKAIFDFIWTDLELCFTLTDIVRTELAMGNREHAERTLAAVRKGHSDLCHLYSRASGLTREQEAELESKFKLLDAQLKQLQPSDRPEEVKPV